MPRTREVNIVGALMPCVPPVIASIASDGHSEALHTESRSAFHNWHQYLLPDMGCLAFMQWIANLYLRPRPS
ncbi:hypothetical protein V8E53_011368 [Lactarius tabidus]